MGIFDSAPVQSRSSTRKDDPEVVARKELAAGLVSDFVLDAAKAKRRCPHGGIYRILYGKGPEEKLPQNCAIGTTWLRPEAQPFVCNAAGKYADGVTEKWQKAGVDLSTLPEDLEELQVLSGKDLPEVYAQWQKAQAEAKAKPARKSRSTKK